MAIPFSVNGKTVFLTIEQALNFDFQEAIANDDGIYMEAFDDPTNGEGEEYINIEIIDISEIEEIDIEEE